MCDEALDDLRRRLASTRWPERELVDGLVAGHPLSTSRTCASTGPTATTGGHGRRRSTGSTSSPLSIDDLDVHFIHVRSPHEDAMPLIITHGWPGSIVEFHKIIEPLDRTRPRSAATRPTRSTSWHRRCPASGSPASRGTTGWGVGKIAEVFAELMARLGYDRYLAQGGDWGSAVTDGDRRDRHRPLHRRPRHAGDGRPAQVRRRADRRRNSGRSPAPPTTRSGTRATRSSRAPARRPSATASSTRPRPRRRGSSRSSGRGPTATATPRTCSPATNCSTT